jgi:hypothetical protein
MPKNLEVDPGTVAVLTLNMVGHALSALNERQILTVEECADICRKAVKNIGESQRQEALDILKVMLPDLRV